MQTASSAIETCNASRSASEYTATVAIPIRRAVLITLQAISPRFAMRIFWNMTPSLRSPLYEHGVPTSATRRSGETDYPCTLWRRNMSRAPREASYPQPDLSITSQKCFLPAAVYLLSITDNVAILIYYCITAAVKIRNTVQMKYKIFAAAVAFGLLPLSVNAQCFNRSTCDPSVLEIRSQISVTFPVADQVSASHTMKSMEESRRDLYALSNRECDTLKAIFGGECSLSSININSSVQDRGTRDKAAFISISNTYEVKRAPSK